MNYSERYTVLFFLPSTYLSAASSLPCCFLILFIIFDHRSAFLLPHMEWLAHSLALCMCVLECVCVCVWVRACTQRQIFGIEGCLNTSICGDRNRSASPSKASKDMTHICLPLCSDVGQRCIHSSRKDRKGKKMHACKPASTHNDFGVTTETQRRVDCSVGLRQQGANFMHAGDSGASW